MLASGPWYASGNFWTAAGVFVGLASAAAIILVTLRVGAPKRLLAYFMPVATSLLTKQSRSLGLTSSGLEVTFRGDALRDPYLVILVVDSRSRRDIRSSDFDQGKSLVFDIGAPIKAVVGGAGPIESPTDVVSVHGSTVNLAPFLIRPGKVMRLSLLTEGSPKLSCRSPLIDVRVREQEPGRKVPWPDSILASIPWFVVAAISVFFLSGPRTKTTMLITAGILGLTLGIVIAILGQSLLPRRGARPGRRATG
jgi:hypothetical protein